MTMDEILTTSWGELTGTRSTLTCAKCGSLLQRAITGTERLDGKPVCDDCYYGTEMEAILRACPIG
jgi:formylmethanofuran dehydrogenase subunit E